MTLRSPDDMPFDTDVLGLFVYGTPEKPYTEWTIVTKHGALNEINPASSEVSGCGCCGGNLGRMLGWVPLPEIELVP